MAPHEPAPALRHVLGGSRLQLPRARVARIEKPEVVARLPQRRRGLSPAIDPAHRTRRQFDAAAAPARDQAAVGERQVLRQRERTITLPRGREDDRVPALGEQLDDAVEVPDLGNVVEEEKDADDPYLIITPLHMLQLSPRAAAYGLACLVAAALAGDLLWMPIQVTDSLGEILDAQRSASAWTSFTSSFGTEAYLRPLRIAQIKGLFDAARGEHYWLVYRGFHALLVIAAAFLFVRALRVTTWLDAAAAAFALAVLTGLHTFRGTVQEAFPINHFLEIAVFCLAALNLARSRGGWWIDAAAVGVFAAAVLTLESGVLVWVVVSAAWLAGWRGISGRGLALMTLCLCAYLYARFGYLSTGVPTLAERSSGTCSRSWTRPSSSDGSGSVPFCSTATTWARP